jgi:ABC-type multidrug transport system permease subunit
MFLTLTKKDKKFHEYIYIFIHIVVFFLIIYDFTDLYNNYKNNNLYTYTNIKKLFTIIIGCICLLNIIFFVVFNFGVQQSDYFIVNILGYTIRIFEGIYIGLHL